MAVDGKKERIYKVKFCEVALGVLVDGVYGRDSQMKLVKEVMIQGMVGVSIYILWHKNVYFCDDGIFSIKLKI